MHWNNASEFFAMGGYALYVWGSFGTCAIAMLLEPLLVRRQRQAVLRMLREHRDSVNSDLATTTHPQP